VVAGALLLWLAAWGRVLAGRRSLVSGDVLYEQLPWSRMPIAHPPSNATAADPVWQFLGWREQVGTAFSHLRLPLWDHLQGSGSPLLANDQSAPFSPFTLMSLPFDPAYGQSLAMLVKLWVAGIGMALLLRVLGCRGTAAGIGGLIYAASSYVTVWLGWPHSSVAALIPWLLAAAEAHLRHRRRWALPAVALVVAAQFLAGHAESSAQFGLAVCVYVVVRIATLRSGGRLRAAAGLAAASAVGLLLAGIQLLPLLDYLHQASLTRGRGSAHLPLDGLITWIVPNGKGNPGIDGGGIGGAYTEWMGFVGVGALVLAGIGLRGAWRRDRGLAAGLAALTGLALLIVYTPFAGVAGRLPGLSAANNVRFLGTAALGLSVLAGLGADALLRSAGRPRRRATVPLVAIAAACLAGLAACGGLLLHEGARVDALLPAFHGQIGFWALVAALSGAAALCLAAAALRGAPPRATVAGFAVLAFAEAALFAVPYQPRAMTADTPPASEAMGWLHGHVGDRSATATGWTMVPNSATLYGVRDVRRYEAVHDDRQLIYWAAADPGFSAPVDADITILDRPGVPWLAAAGVASVMTPQDAPLPGTIPVHRSEGVVISDVPGARPYAFAASGTRRADGPAHAAALMAADPLGPVVVESARPAPGGEAGVTVRDQQPGAVDLAVDASAPATVVVLESWAPGWTARVDGTTVPVRPANVLFVSVSVPAGRHDVVLEYRPASVPAGLAVSAAGVVALLVLALAPRISTRLTVLRRL
jgi:hypothetical protein